MRMCGYYTRKVNRQDGQRADDLGHVGDDLNIKGLSSSFPKQLKVKPGEEVVFSWITYKSKAQRNAVNKKVMADPRMANFDPSTMPFDIKRMLMGGFRSIVDK